MPRVPFLFKATENIPHTPGSFLSPFFVPKRIGCKALALRRHPPRKACNTQTTPEYPPLPRQIPRHPPDVRASLQARASRPSTASGHSLVPPLPRSNALLRRHAPKPETAHHHGHCPTSVWPCPHPPVLISCRQAHRRSPLVPDLDHTSVLHHLRSDIYETLSLLPHGIRQLVDEEVPTCVTSPFSGSVSVGRGVRCLLPLW